MRNLYKRRYKKGTNQYRVKRRLYMNEWLALFLIFIIIVAGMAHIYEYAESKVKTVFAQEELISPLSNPTPTPIIIYKEYKKEFTQSEIENYVKTIFGRFANVAIAVSKNECSPLNPQYPKCVYHTSQEYSVGLFQINLFNASHWIHAKKVPGETIEEKAEWLKNPMHNTLVAYKIFSDSGFNPWTAYTSGNYLKDL